MKTPVVLIVFNRPKQTQRVLKALQDIRPETMIVVSDAPRPEVQADVEVCKHVKALIDTMIDWDCALIKHYASSNKGSGFGPAEGITAAFQQFEELIILEDDCLPAPDFFPFCEDLLEHYRHTPQIMGIGGMNVQNNWPVDNASYFFTYYGQTWGWATWRRAWDHFDIEAQYWDDPEVRNRVRNILNCEKSYQRWDTEFKRIRNGQRPSVWDFQWRLARWAHDGLMVLPGKNLIQNIGFGPDATHTKNRHKAKVTEVQLHQLDFPLIHPEKITPDVAFDSSWLSVVQPDKPLYQRLTPASLRSLIKKLIHLVGARS